MQHVLRVALVACLSLWGSPASDAQWSPTETITSFVPPQLTDPVVAVYGDAVVVASASEEFDGVNPLPTSGNILVFERVVGSWRPPVEALDAAIVVGRPSLAFDDGGGLHLVWQDLARDFVPVAFRYKRSPLTGDNTIETVSVRPLGGPTAEEIVGTPYFLFANAQHTPVLLFEVSTQRASELARTTRGPTGWTEAAPTVEAFNSDIIQTSGDTLLSATRLWTGDAFAVTFSRSTDGGTSWSPPAVVTETPDGAQDLSPRIAATSDRRLHVVWRRSTGGGFSATAFMYAASADGGATWSQARAVPVPPGGVAGGVVIVGGDDRAHVFVEWRKTYTSPTGRLYHTSTRGGAWSAPDWFTGDAKVRYSHFNPAIAVDGGRIHVIWSEDVVPDRESRLVYASARLADLPAPAVPPVTGRGLSTYPNPTRDTVSLSFTLDELGEDTPGEVVVRVYDARGRLALEHTVGRQSDGPQSVSLGTASLASGTYTVQVRAGRTTRSGTFTVVR